MSNDELHVIVIDEDGKITGIVGEILEVFEGLSQLQMQKIQKVIQTTMLIKLDTTQTTSSGQTTIQHYQKQVTHLHPVSQFHKVKVQTPLIQMTYL